MTSTSSRLGYVYYPDDRHFTQEDLRLWLPILKSLKANWITLYASSERAVPETFLSDLLQAGIEPLILMRGDINDPNPSAMLPLLRSYARWGVKYVAIYDRPNLRSNWSDADWNNKRFLERFVDQLIPLLEMQRTVDLKPVLPPLEPGGDYWDTAFLRSALESLARRGKSDLLQDLHLAIYAWTYSKPIDWGSGGPSRWPEARPYHTPPNCQDQIGFRAFEWYADIAKQVIGHTPPMLVVAGGVASEAVPENGYSDIQIEQTIGLIRALEQKIPDYLLNMTFFCLTAATDTPEINAAWYPAPTSPAPIVEAVQQVLRSQVKEATTPVSKSLKHYVLLPEEIDLNFVWKKMCSFAKTHKPVIGFSKNEARMAYKVTLVGEEKSFSQTLEQELVDAGCVIERLNLDQKQDREASFSPSYPNPAIKYTPLGGS